MQTPHIVALLGSRHPREDFVAKTKGKGLLDGVLMGHWQKDRI